jgi:hypothetical protein
MIRDRIQWRSLHEVHNVNGHMYVRPALFLISESTRRIYMKFGDGCLR